MTICDIIVVGAGSAGCLLANQLVRRTGFNVVLLEPTSKSAQAIDRQRPSRWLGLLGSDEDWNLATEPNPALAGRVLRWPRGRGLGGCGRINAMIWFPPSRQDFQTWSTASGGAWSLSELNESLAEVTRLVQPEPARWLSEPSRCFLEAARHGNHDGAMVYDRVCRGGRRWTPAELLLEGNPAELSEGDAAELRGGGSRGALKIIRATVQRVLWSGDKAIGVQLQNGSSGEQLRCRHGVVLCAGSIASPAILMRSGLGPKEVLVDAGIDCRRDAHHVGGGLQDHLIMPVIFGIDSQLRFDPRASMRDLARWQTTGGGPVSSNIAECGGLFNDGKYQIHVTPTHYLTHPKPNSPAAMTMAVNVTAPASRGRITITSPDARQSPQIETGCLSDDRDLQATIDGVRLCREIAEIEPLAGLLRGELLPGLRRVDDELIAKSVRRFAQTLYHPLGTCRMGADPDSVVEASLRVRGVENLWIADASILPSMTTGNPNAAVMTVAVRCWQMMADTI